MKLMGSTLHKTPTGCGDTIVSTRMTSKPFLGLGNPNRKNLDLSHCNPGWGGSRSIELGQVNGATLFFWGHVTRFPFESLEGGLGYDQIRVSIL